MGFGAEFSPGDCEYKETSGLDGLGCELNLTSHPNITLFPAQAFGTVHINKTHKINNKQSSS